ncbi:MAG TPA: DNA polymerase III subunit gamma/tau [Bacteroidales bacterium]|mgnify:CR=1 FL=1|jgi:DNA polymerase-3 subunit gamma/tau|nr:DNA polymerase III subunit gamma/tau [Bacteroidales bacterium]HOF46537.1 DNA polymerase III subunit gamma/tau [Bacteroidales bacterium]HOS58118.1 DNA polymerase III subunit gamma/tau [Bacteroidales bacterium]HRR04163.1 DNA polymerase III subunit gamma/tau [Bacteroidales bacterium]HRT13877.1 DNA polymerase III subunit gamma/tau [Bacteroidales bacterium]
MENFIVSARKYRPMTFKSVVGQDAIVATLKNSIKTKQIAQAFLFCGPRGVGKTTCARIFAKALNCLNLTEDFEPCNECESCRSFNESASFNVYELDAASNNSVEDIRSLIEQVRINPQGAKYKVYIIDEVHMLSSTAFNAFLKTLEEPPAYVKFILATTEKHKIIPTILSRCQLYDFKRISDHNIVKHLQFVAENENITADEEALRVIAHKADGALRDALSIFDQLVSFSGNHLTYQAAIENLNVLDVENYFNITDYLFSDNIADALLLFDDILNRGFDGQHFIMGLAGHFRNLLIAQNPNTAHLLETSNTMQVRFVEQAKKIDSLLLLRALELANNCDFNYKLSNNKRFSIEITLMQINANYMHTQRQQAVRQSREGK